MDINPESSRAAKKTSRSAGRGATLKEVAAEVGVSAATVSNAFNRLDQLSPALRERVLETAKRLGYAGPNPMARGLRRGRAGAIGVLYTDRLSYAFSDPVSVMFLEGVSTATEEAGLGLLLIPGGSMDSRDTDAVGRAAVDGFLVYCMADGDALVQVAMERRLPAVFVDQPPIEGVPSIGIDDEGAARKMAEHLLDLGHRRFGAVSMELAPGVVGGIADLERQGVATYRPSRERLKGYAAALEEAGIPWESVPVYEAAENAVEEGRVAARSLLSRNPRPTALFALSDQLALGVLGAADGLGLSVPEDVSVAGFDDIPAAARTSPALTTVNQPHIEKGLLAGRLLVAQIAGDEPERPTLLPTRLVVRDSTAPPADS